MASLAEISIRFSTNLKEFSTKMQNATRELNKVGKQMQSTGRRLTTGITLPLVAAAGAAAKLGVEFDDNMTKIQTLVGVSSDRVKEFRGEVLKLGGRTAKAPAELSDALFTVTSAGLRGAEAMEVLESSAKASAVGLGETKEVARATTAVIQAYGKENMSAARAADILTATVREGNLEASELAPVLGRVIGISAQLGISFEEVGASIATFTRLGVDSAEAVTGLRGIMNSLISPTSEGEAALARYGMTMRDLREEVKGKGLAVTLMRLIKTFKGNEEALGAIIPNVRALAAVLGTAGAQGKEYQRIVQSLTASQGMLDHAFDQTSKTAGFKLRKALADLKVVGTQFGDVILPVIADLSKKISGLLSGLQNLNPATRKTIVEVAALAATIGPAVFVVGKMITTVYAASQAIRVFSLALSASPIGLAITGVTVLAAAFGAFNIVGKAMGKTSESITQSVKNERNELNNLVNTITGLNESNEVRASLLKDLKSKYPDFLGNLDTEKATNEQLRDRLKEVNKEYITKIAIAAAEEELTKNLKDQNKAFQLQKNALQEIERLKTKLLRADNKQTADDLTSRIQAQQAIVNTSIFELNRLRDAALETKKSYEELAGSKFSPKSQGPPSSNTIGASEAFKLSALKMPKIEGDLFGDLRKMQRELHNTNLEMIKTSDGAKTMAIKVVNPVREIHNEFKRLSSIKSVFPNFDDVGSKISFIREQIVSMINDGVNPASAAIKQMNDQLTELTKIETITKLSLQLGETMTGVFTDIMESGQNAFKSIINVIGRLIKRLIAAAAAALILTALLPGGSGKGKDALSFGTRFKKMFSSFSGLGGIAGSRASGGPVTAGLQYIAGEHSRGEIFVPNQNGRIYPMMENRSGSITGLSSQGQRLVAVVSGQDLKFILDNYDRSLGRMGI